MIYDAKKGYGVRNMRTENKQISNQADDGKPWLIFKLDGGLYAIGSHMVSSILRLPDTVSKLPEAPDFIRGLMNFRGRILALLDMRDLYQMESMEQEYIDFKTMLDERKEDHVRWVKELERSIVNEEEFTLATDPHDCAFGKWYYGFKSDLHNINFQLKKIEEPHNKLHAAAEAVKKCFKRHDECQREECLKEILTKTKEKLMPEVLRLIDETKEVFHHRYQNKVVVIGDRGAQIGLIVDEVVSVETLSAVGGSDAMRCFLSSKYIAAVGQTASRGGLIFMLDGRELIAHVKQNAETMNAAI